MAGLWIPRTAQKPPVGARINWRHPLAQGLIGFWALNEGARNPCNLVSPDIPTVVGSAPPWASTVDGTGLTYPNVGAANAAVQLGGIDDYSAMPPPFVVVCRCFVQTTTNNLLYSSRTTSLNGGYELLLGGGGVAGAVGARALSSNGTRLSTTSISPVLSATERASAVTCVSTYEAYDSGGLRVGLKLAVHTPSRVAETPYASEPGTGITLAANTQPLTIGARAATNLSVSGVQMMALYARSLTLEEQAWLHAEPYAMLTR